jgi:hypothetical protein
VARRQAFGCFNSLVRKSPAYVLELGSDLNSTPIAIRELLDRSLDSKDANYGS